MIGRAPTGLRGLHRRRYLHNNNNKNNNKYKIINLINLIIFIFILFLLFIRPRGLVGGLNKH